MKVKISELKHHPLNGEIYQLSDIDELTESIKTVGLLQSITINSKNEIISGNRRFEGCIRLGITEVDVVKLDIKPEDEVLYLINFNSQRKKKVSELLSEYDFLKDYYKKNKLTEKGDTVRNMVSKKLKLTDGQLARLLFIRKHRIDFISLIDKGIITTAQAYLQTSREVKENQSRNSNGDDFKPKFQFSDSNFKFFQKSSDKMNEIETGTVTTIFCSPPYPNKVRVYSNYDTIGNENSIEEYSERLSEHLSDCYRILSEKGSFYLNLGDVFLNGNLQLSPHKVIFKLLEKNKWIVRNTIHWKKSNYKPSSTKSNLTPSYEYIFHLVKSQNYFYERMYLPLSGNTRPSSPPRHRSHQKKSVINNIYIPNPDGKNLPDYWDEETIITAVSNQKNNNGIEHPAMFPVGLPTVPIIQTSVLPFLKSNLPENICSIICDPFSGSQSTYKSVEFINKMYGTNLQYVGYDIKKYF